MSTSNPSHGQYAFGDNEKQRQAFAGRTVERDLSFLVPHLRSGQRIADCGCGGGGLSVQLTYIVSPGLVYGFDQSEKAIAQAKELASTRGVDGVQFSVATVYDSGLEKGSYDVVLFCGVLAHVAEPARALRHAYELLKPGGIVAAREPQKEGDWFGGKNNDAVAEVNQMYVADFVEVGGDPFLGRRLKGLIQEAGFTDVEATPSFSPALSSVQVAGPGFANRVQDSTYVEKTVRRGKYTVEDVRSLADRVAAWRADPAAVVGISECTALGWKPK